MKSSFFEFNVAISGLFTSRAGLETVSHNTANAATRGYSRQVALTRASTPLTLYNGRGMMGTGSEVYGVTQIRDVYLDKKYWNGMATLGEYAAKRSQLAINQSILSELEGTGLSTQFNNLFDTINDLITNSGDLTYRSNVLSSADSLTTFLKDTYEVFARQQKDVNEEIRSVVTTINSIGAQIKTLNEKIRVMECSGDRANDLRDQRALLVDELSRYVNTEVSEVTFAPNDVRYFVKINGQDFVMNNNLRLLECRERTEMVYDDKIDANGNTVLDINGEDWNNLSASAVPGANPGEYTYSINGATYTSGSGSLLFFSNGKGIVAAEYDGTAYNVVQVQGTDDTNGTVVSTASPRDENGNILSSLSPAQELNSAYIYRNPEDSPGLYDIYWAGTGAEFNIYHQSLTGELKGLIDVRDGNNGNHTKSQYTSGCYDDTKGQLTLTLDPNKTRIDISESGGVIRITSSVTGLTTELSYKNFTSKVNADGTREYVFNLTENSIEDMNNPAKSPFNDGDQLTIGQTDNYKGIPYYLSRLNTLARTFTYAMNFGKKLNGDPLNGVIGHIYGFNSNGTHGDGTAPPTLFFSYINELTGEHTAYSDNPADPGYWDVYKITAKNFFVYDKLMENPALLNAADKSSTESPETGGGGTDNNNVLLSLLNVFSDNSLFSEGRLLDYIVGMTSEMGIDVKQAQNFEINYTSVTAQIDNQRMSISGVDINEEMVDMIRYNQQFQAASRLINIIDGIYDTLCNRIGLT